jgi:serine/threonine-protein kinase RsbW
MCSRRLVACRHEAVPPAGHADAWQCRSLVSTAASTSIIEGIVALMASGSFSEKDRFATRLALEEALVNAVKHGNQCDPTRRVDIRYRVTDDEAVIEITDEGNGFDPNDVPDPCAVENMERSCGRGVFLIRHYMTWVRYNDRGNCVTMGKRPA